MYWQHVCAPVAAAGTNLAVHLCLGRPCRGRIALQVGKDLTDVYWQPGNGPPCCGPGCTSINLAVHLFVGCLGFAGWQGLDRRVLAAWQWLHVPGPGAAADRQAAGG